ncbi:TPA: AAA family ATPase [Candidatus Dependentiae bacterium]|nr:MAG: AAA family ATPase [candidate division TM6 bacterium GW2011_GWE2_31_21]KKP52935.1 MAG: AAA family ATPase [candidate division TM6 bacterium GW2011_GWF2_33_332]HBS47824.1 AAA family ATPase [Candidatus Dependentiae bacterium]HBZ73200.1 AAA family ATPase [Candidatus Dependentiae bacterium]
MFKRDIEATLIRYAKFPVITILGPRQSGKTTLAKKTFKKYAYTSLEDPATRDLAQNDPHKFFQAYENKHGIIIDEFQRVPDILSYIQLEVDEKKRPGYFVLTGSQNFLMNQAITQSLAGRSGILILLPLSINELQKNKLLTKNNINEIIFKGGYPQIYAEDFPPQDAYPSYIQSYVERDVRQLTNVGDLRSFQKFIQLCAGRVGQLLNLSELGGVCGISATTAERWLAILEASYVLYTLRPYHQNFNKRLTKSPKIYFYDTGLVCSLLEINSPETLAFHPLRGNIFENFIISDIYKQYFNTGQRPPVYFWRDLNGRLEVDCIIETASTLFPIEIKSGETIASDYFTNLKEWDEITNISPDHNYVIYGGKLKQSRTSGNIIGWKEAGNLIKQLQK